MKIKVPGKGPKDDNLKTKAEIDIQIRSDNYSAPPRKVGGFEPPQPSPLADARSHDHLA